MSTVLLALGVAVGIVVAGVGGGELLHRSTECAVRKRRRGRS